MKYYINFVMLAIVTSVATAFDPKSLEFKITLLLDHVPEVVFGDWRQKTDVSVLNFIDYKSTFITNFDTYKYLINVEEEEFQDLNQDMVDDMSDYWIVQQFHHLKDRFHRQVRLINQILKRHRIYSVYLVENKAQDYVLLIDSDSSYKLDDIVKWLTNYESHKLPRKQSWCTHIDYFHEVKIVKVGEPVRSCDDIMNVPKKEGEEQQFSILPVKDEL